MAILVLTAAAALSPGATQALAQTGASEYQVKAAYLYNFAKSIEWPKDTLPANSPLVIGVVGGDDEFVDTLIKTVAGRSAGDHAVAAKRADSVEELDHCHIVFFRSSAGHKRTEAALKALASASILLVGEDDGFLRQGGMINLVLKHGTVRFEVDQAFLDRANLRLSPELLALALGQPERSTSPSPSSSTNPPDSRRLKAGAPPEYPEIARKMNLTGVVQVEVSVRRDGTVEDVKVIGGHPVLADALVKAVERWRYEPAAQNSRLVVKFTFAP
jgi:TonB family protein